jgi:hypothetical protein
VSAKLQAFYDGLKADEQEEVRALLQAAGNPEVTGFSDFWLPATVGGKTIFWRPSDGGAGGTNPNQGTDGATIAGQPGGTPSSGTTAGGISIRF